MRILATLFLALTVAVCAPLPLPPPPDADPWAGGHGGECFTLEVQNDRFERAVVYHGTTYRRLLAQEGKTTGRYEVCGPSEVGAEAMFRIKLIGNGETLVRSQGPGRIDAGAMVWIHIRHRDAQAWHGNGSD